MSDPRRTRHVWNVVVCVVVMIATTGCRQSPFHRHGDDRPTGPDGKPVGYQPPQSWLDQASTRKPAPPASAKIVAPASLAVATTAAKAVPPPPAVASAPVAPAETPMLDAALKRAEAIEADQRRTVREALQPTPEVQLATFTAPRKAPEAEPAPRRDDAVHRASAELTDVDKARLWNTAAGLIDRLPAAAAAAVPAALPHTVALFVPPPEAKPDAAPEVEPASEARPEPGPESSPFTVNEVRLCRSIEGFGAFEPMDAHAPRAGRPLLIYSEPAGLRYNRQDDEYVSRIATRVALIADDGAPVWQIDGEAEDHCRKPRRDSFLGTRIDLPDDLAPGRYTIRLTLTDALARQSATAEIPVTIAR